MKLDDVLSKLEAAGVAANTVTVYPSAMYPEGGDLCGCVIEYDPECPPGAVYFWYDENKEVVQ